MMAAGGLRAARDLQRALLAAIALSAHALQGLAPAEAHEPRGFHGPWRLGPLATIAKIAVVEKANSEHRSGAVNGMICP